MDQIQKYCPNCGAKVVAGDKFCDHCGTKLTSDTTTEAPAKKVPVTAPAPKAGATLIAKLKNQKNPTRLGIAVVVGLVIVAVVIFLLIPKGLSGQYVERDKHTDLLGGKTQSVTTFTFKGKHYTYKYVEKFQDIMGEKTNRTQKEQGTYEVDGQEVHFTSDRNSTSLGTLSKDKQHLTYGGASFAKVH